MIFLIVMAVSAFIATNIDDLFLLMAFFSLPKFQTREVVLGQYLGISALIIISSLAYFFQFIIPSFLLGFLGVFPILIGLKNLLERKSDYKQFSTVKKDLNNSYYKIKDKSKGSNVIQVILTTFANGGDNIGIYAPLFAVLNWEQIPLVITVFMVLTGIWCLISFYMINNKIFGDKIGIYVHYVFPFILIAIGVVIIARGIWGMF